MNIPKYLISTLATIFVVSGIAYAANTISSVTTQTIGE